MNNKRPNENSSSTGRASKQSRSSTSQETSKLLDDDDDSGVEDMTQLDTHLRGKPHVMKANSVSLEVRCFRAKRKGADPLDFTSHPCFIVAVSGSALLFSKLMRAVFTGSKPLSTGKAGFTEHLPMEFTPGHGLFFFNNSLPHVCYDLIGRENLPFPCWMAFRSVTKLASCPILTDDEMMEKTVWYLTDYLNGSSLSDIKSEDRISVELTQFVMGKPTCLKYADFIDALLEKNKSFYDEHRSKPISVPSTPI